MMDCIATLAALAEAGRAARISYRRPGSREPSIRLVEPYRLVEYCDALMVHCWQVHPICEKRNWRYFRTYRIDEVVDAGTTFTPRRPVTLNATELEAHLGVLMRESTSAVEEYEQFLAQVIAGDDCDLEHEQMQRARELAGVLLPHELSVVHAKLYGQLLMEMAQDEMLLPHDEEFLRDLWALLSGLGWEP